MLDITSVLDTFARVLIPGQVKLTIVQFFGETFLLRRFFNRQTDSHHCQLFHNPFLFCNSFPFINLKLSCCDHFMFHFLPTIQTSIHPFDSLAPSCLTVMIKIVLLFILASLLFIRILQLFHKAFNYVSFRGMVLTMYDRIHSESTKVGLNC